ncbi:MAG: lipid II flippase MurJ, partial [Verrucomicrobiota bacterium]
LIFGSGSLGIHALIFGTVIGALLQAVLLYVHFFRNHCQKIGFSLKSWLSEDMRLVVKTMIPYLLAGVVMESTVIVDVGMAGMLDSGSVSVLTYAERVCAIGLTLALTAVSGAIYPYLADLVAQERWIELRRTIYRFGGLTLVGSIPVIGIIWGGSEWIVGTLFERGEFTSDDTARVSVVLRWLSLQIPFFILAVLGSRVVCAMLASKFMLFTTFVNLGLNILFNYLFMQWIGLAGIALSTSMVYAFSAFMLFAYFHVQVNRRIREGSQTEEKAS